MPRQTEPRLTGLVDQASHSALPWARNCSVHAARTNVQQSACMVGMAEHLLLHARSNDPCSSFPHLKRWHWQVHPGSPGASCTARDVVRVRCSCSGSVSVSTGCGGKAAPPAPGLCMLPMGLSIMVAASPVKQPEGMNQSRATAKPSCCAACKLGADETTKMLRCMRSQLPAGAGLRPDHRAALYGVALSEQRTCTLEHASTNHEKFWAGQMSDFRQHQAQ